MRDLLLEPTNASRPGLKSQEKSAFPRLVGIFGWIDSRVKVAWSRFQKSFPFFSDFSMPLLMVACLFCFFELWQEIDVALVLTNLGMRHSIKHSC